MTRNNRTGLFPGQGTVGRLRKPGSLRPAMIAVGCLTAMTLSGCGAGNWFGEEEEILPGKRVPVLITENTVTADPDARSSRVVLTRPYINEAWPQAGGYPTHAMYHLALGKDLREVFAANTGAGVTDEYALIAEPVINGQVIYAMDSEGRVSAFDENNGRRLWENFITPDEEEDSVLGGGLAYDQGLVVVATSFAEVIALRARDGQVVWRSRVAGPVRTAPTLSSSRAYVVTLDNRVVALSLRDGSQIWEHSAGSESAALLGGASPASDGEVVIVPYSTGEVYGLDAGTGRVRWSDSVVAIRRSGISAGISDIRAMPVIDRDRVFVLGSNARMIALDRLTGARIWERDIGGTNTPWVAGDFLYIISSENELICMRRSDGRVVWVKPLLRWEDPDDKTEPVWWYGPHLASDRLVMVSNTGEAWAVSPYDGSLKGAMELADGVSVPPVIANGTLYLLANDGYLYAYR